MSLRNPGRLTLFVAELTCGSVLLAGCSSPSGRGGTSGGTSPPSVVLATADPAPGCTPLPSNPGSACGGGGPSAGGGFLDPAGSQPDFGATDTTGTPPPITGGTLLVTVDGSTAIAADPDRDLVYGVDLNKQALAFTIRLRPGDEPGRLAEDGAGRIHVALRRGGALVSIDRATGTTISRRAVCPAPRGVAWAASSDLVWVACATGELVAFPSAGGPATQSLVVERDLRDVIVQPDGTLVVSKFRSAEILHVRDDGSIDSRNTLPSLDAVSDAHVAWRTIAGPTTGSTISVYQTESTRPVITTGQGAYGGGLGGFPPSPPPVLLPDGGLAPALSPDGGPELPTLPPSIGNIVASVVTILGNDGSTARAPSVLPQAVVPVDLALSPDDNEVAVAAAGNGFGTSPSIWFVGGGGTWSLPWNNQSPVVAVAFDGRGNVLAQTLEPEANLTFVSIAAGLLPQLPSMSPTKIQVSLSTAPNHNSGHDIFHTQAGASIACASCHPEGGDDGHVWLLDGLPRRTPSLRGTIAGTAPYHWPGEELDMSMLINDVYTHRMAGAKLRDSLESAVQTWVEAIPAPPAPSWLDSNAAQRGQKLFNGSAGCASCHSGPKFTNNATMDVGTGKDQGREPDGGAAPKAFQVPPLVGVGWRAPFLHDGCANTLADRFGKCATPQHGVTAQLSAQDIEDLTAYLESL